MSRYEFVRRPRVQNDHRALAEASAQLVPRHRL